MAFRLQDILGRITGPLAMVNRYRRQIALGIVLLAMALGYYFSQPAVAEQKKGLDNPLVTEKAEIVLKDGKSITFNLEIAKSPVDLQMGLMYRQDMDDDHGMLFQMGRPPREVSFYMKNTYIPLDMLFVGENGEIKNIHHNAVPHSLTSIPSKFPVTGVIEINGGLAEELGINVGDMVHHRYFRRVHDSIADPK